MWEPNSPNPFLPTYMGQTAINSFKKVDLQGGGYLTKVPAN